MSICDLDTSVLNNILDFLDYMSINLLARVARFMHDLTDIYIREKYGERCKFLVATYSYSELTRNYRIRDKKCDVFANSNKSLPEKERRYSTAFQIRKHLDIYESISHKDKRRYSGFDRMAILIDCNLDMLAREDQMFLINFKEKLLEVENVAKRNKRWRNVYDKHEFLLDKINFAISIRKREMKAIVFSEDRNVRERIKFWETLA
jgi:hypothetical protein